MVGSSEILNASILVVDDQEANVLLLEQMLRSAGYTSVASTRDSREVCELQLIEAGHHRLVVDMGDVHFVDSSGLGALVSALKTVKLLEGGGDIRSPTSSRLSWLCWRSSGSIGCFPGIRRSSRLSRVLHKDVR